MVVSELEHRILGDEDNPKRVILPAILLGLLLYSSCSDAGGLGEARPHYDTVGYNPTPSYLVGE